MKNYNFYKISEKAFMAMLILICMIFANEETKPLRYALAITMSICSITFIIQLLKSATVVNKSDKIIMAKLEDRSCNLVEVKPGESLFGIIGIKSNGRVYKVHDTTTIVVNKDGTVKTQSLTGKFMNLFNAGYISEAPDESWKTLFNS